MSQAWSTASTGFGAARRGGTANRPDPPPYRCDGGGDDFDEADYPGEPAPRNWPADADPPGRDERHRANVRQARRNGWELVADDGATYRWRASLPADHDAAPGGVVGGHLVVDADAGVAYEIIVRPHPDDVAVGHAEPTAERSVYYPALEVARYNLVLDLAELEPADLAATVAGGDWP